jgi:hypothetical protein
VALLKGRIEALEKELVNQEIELKAANKTLKDKSNDPTVSTELLISLQLEQNFLLSFRLNN